MFYKVKDKITVLTSKDKLIDGTISSIVDGRVYAVKFLNDKNEQDLYWIEDGDSFVLDVPDLTCATSADCNVTLSADPVNTSPSGSLRFNSGKTQIREIDPRFIQGMGEVLTKSREKYNEFNWQLDTKLSTPMDSLERHWLSFKGGEDIDPDDQMYHLYKVAVNAMFIMFHLRNNPEKSDDRGFKGKK